MHCLAKFLYAIALIFALVVCGSARAAGSFPTSLNEVALPNPSVYTQAVSVTIAVYAAGSPAIAAGGSVDTYDNGTYIGTNSVSGGVASYQIIGLSAGSHSIQVNYSGDGFYAGSSVGWNQVVNSDTSVSVSSPVNPSTYGQSITVSASVAAVAPAGGTPTGSLNFLAVYSYSPLKFTFLGNVQLSGGTASIHTTAIAAGSSTLEVDYVPDNTAAYSASSGFQGQTVNPDATTTTLATSANPSVSGQSVTFTATVSANAPGNGTPTGSVTFTDGASTLGSSLLTSGVATLSTTLLVVGSHSIKATYTGDANFNTSASNTIAESIKVNTSTTLGSSLNPSVFGQGITFTATVSSSPVGTTPSGKVTFSDSGTTLGSVSLSGAGTATLTTAALVPGTHSIAATYGGDANCNSSSASLTGTPQVVNQANSTVGVVSSLNPSTHGQPVTLLAAVGIVMPGVATPTGTVTFKDGSSTLGSAPLSNLQASLTTSALTVGPHSISVVYNGDANVAGSTGLLSGGETVIAAPGVLAISASGPAFARYGQSVTYTIQVSNSGDITVGGTVTDNLPAQMVAATANWICTPSGGATCGTGTGSISDSISVPGSASILYALSATIDSEAHIGVDSFTNTARATNLATSAVVSAPMTTTIVLFRNSFENGENGALSLPGVPFADMRAGAEPMVVELATSALAPGEPTTLVRGTASTVELFRVEALRVDATRAIAHVVVTDGPVEHAGPWFDAGIPVLGLALSEDGTHLIVASGPQLQDLAVRVAGTISLQVAAAPGASH